MNEPQTIRDRGLSEPDGEVLAAVLIESEDTIRECSGVCSDCERIQSCMN